MKLPSKKQITKTALSAGFGAWLALSGVTEYKRGKVSDILDDGVNSHKSKIQQFEKDDTITEAQKILIVKIHTKQRLLQGNIENNKRLHGFWSMPGSKLPLFGNTEKWLNEIQGRLQTAKNTSELEKIDKDLKNIIREFNAIMKKDEDAIQQELNEGISHISDKDIQSIQTYMRECLTITKNELSLGGISADYTGTFGSDLEKKIQNFITETDSKEAKATLNKIVNYYSSMYDSSGSELMLHHLAEIGKRLEAEDSLTEKAYHWGLISILIILSLIAVKKLVLPTVVRMGKKGIQGLVMVLWGELLDRLEKMRK